jgi:nitroreductase
MDIIFERRSIRKYTGQSIPDDLIETILRAGMAAPSAGNEQPWQFIVTRDRETLLQMMRSHPYAQMLREADCAITVCGDLALEKYKGFWVQDCSAATQNMLLEAHALGIGSVWLGVYPLEERITALRQLLSIPEHAIPLCIISLGYPNEKKEPRDSFNKERVHSGKW